jgi:hypothetical protein
MTFENNYNQMKKSLWKEQRIFGSLLLSGFGALLVALLGLIVWVFPESSVLPTVLPIWKL